MIFLASEAAQVIDRIDQRLPKTARRVSFITTASNVYSEAPWVAADRDALVRIGREVASIDLSVTKTASLEAQLLQSDIIFVCGGNTYYLLQESHKSGFSTMLPSLLSQGKHYIGSSAGSLLLGPSLRSVRSLDDPTQAPDLTSEEALGLVPFVPLVHFGKEKYFLEYQKALEQAFRNSESIVSIRDDQLLVCSEDGVRWG